MTRKSVAPRRCGGRCLPRSATEKTGRHIPRFGRRLFSSAKVEPPGRRNVRQSRHRILVIHKRHADDFELLRTLTRGQVTWWDKRETCRTGEGTRELTRAQAALSFRQSELRGAGGDGGSGRVLVLGRRHLRCVSGSGSVAVGVRAGVSVCAMQLGTSLCPGFRP